MLNFKQALLLLSFLFFSSNFIAERKNSEYVNPKIGTIKMGHTFPGACFPHGSVQLSPDTDTIPQNIEGKYQKNVYKYCAGYQYDDSTIVGFSHTHLSGTGHSDLGDILIMPTTGSIMLNPGVAENPDKGYRSRFNHDTEVSKPGYYEVMLDDYGIKAQLTATPRTGVHKYIFPKGSNQQIIIDLVHGIYNYNGKVLWSSMRVESDTLITGYRITNGWSKENYTYFAISLSKPIVDYGYVDKEKPQYTGFWKKFDLNNNFPEIGGRKIVSYFKFDSTLTQSIEIKVALSGVSTEGAILNLNKEAKGKSFDELANIAAKSWEEELNIIEIEGNVDQKTLFYTTLYHTLINPSIYMDVDKKYRGIDHNIHTATDFTNYTVFSVWDTYRALHPLFNIINKERNKDMLNSMLAHFDQSVHHALPVWSHMGNENWCMIGYHSVSVLADALSKGIDLDKGRVLQAMVSSSNIDYYDQIDEYKKLGYVPFDKNRSGSSITLEYAYDDWTIYRTASQMGQNEIANEYKKRALNYKNVYNPELKFVGAKYANGKWKKPFSLLNTHGEGFIEGNSLNYSFYVPHDVIGMISAMGGDKQFIINLDTLFNMHLPKKFFEDTEDVTEDGLLGGYVHGNEPSHHIAYLYTWTSQPWKTQYWVREIMNKMYKNSIDGLCGNDDCGQMSAWYIFSAMGFYPVCPGTDQYVLGAPYLPYLKVKLSNGKYLEIEADGISDKNRYVKSVYLNGVLHNNAYITQSEIEAGGILSFNMTDKPNKQRKFSIEEKPYSLTQSSL